MDSSSRRLLPLIMAVLVVALGAAGAYILHLRGRIADTASPAAAPAPRPASDANAPAAAGAGSGDALTPSQEQAMVEVLRAEQASGRKAWLLAQQSKAEATAAQAEIKAVFEQAGWPVETMLYPSGLKSGIVILAADEEPPAFVTTVNDAFSAAGLDVKYLTGYREYFNSKRASDPNWRGPELAADQPFILVIGSKPAPKAAE